MEESEQTSFKTKEKPGIAVLPESQELSSIQREMYILAKQAWVPSGDLQFVADFFDRTRELGISFLVSRKISGHQEISELT